MAPKTRSIRKNTTEAPEDPLTSEKLLKNEHFEQIIDFESKTNNVSELISDFYAEVDNLVEENSTARLDSIILKQAVRNCFKSLLLIPKVEIKTAIEEDEAPQHFTHRKRQNKTIAVKEEPNSTLELFHTKSFTLSSSSDGDSEKTAIETTMEETQINTDFCVFKNENSGGESVMEVGSGPGTFHNKSFTLTSSDDDDNDGTAVSEDSSMEEKQDSVMEVGSGPKTMNSCHDKSFTLSSSDDEDLNETALDETANLLGDMSMNGELDLRGPLHSSTPRSPKVVRSAMIGMSGSAQFSTRLAKISEMNISRRRGLQTPKTESSVKPPVRNLHTPKKEPNELVNNNKSTHASALRQKFLDQKVEKAKKQNEKRTGVLERKRAQEKIKSESYKSPSRSGALMEEKRTPSQRPSKKTKIHVSEHKEEKKVMLFPPAKDVPGTSSSSKKTANSYTMTPEKVYTAKSATDYGLDDLSSTADTDDESDPRKAIPAWADFDVVRRAVQKHVEEPPFDIDVFFGAVEKPNLVKIFGDNFTLKKRGSSATWK